MPANKVTVTDTWTLVKATTKDTLVANSTIPVAVCVGDTDGVTFDMGVPVDQGQMIVFPAGVSVYAIAQSGRQASMWWTDFGA
jgi:hypothetical protein